MAACRDNDILTAITSEVGEGRGIAAGGERGPPQGPAGPPIEGAELLIAAAGGDPW